MPGSDVLVRISVNVRTKVTVGLVSVVQICGSSKIGVTLSVLPGCTICFWFTAK